MSTRFTIICDTCEEVGPHIRRHHQGAFCRRRTRRDSSPYTTRRRPRTTGAHSFSPTNTTNSASRQSGGSLCPKSLPSLPLPWMKYIAHREEEKA